MDPTNKTKPEETSETPNNINESEWCEYSGMPSPAYYLKEEEKNNDENPNPTKEA